MPASCSRRAAVRRAIAAVPSLPEWAADMRPIRGRCRKRRCGSRWAIPRVSLDFTSAERVDRLATLECVTCGRVWRRIAVPPIRSAAGYQAVKLTVILPAHAKRWHSRGRWHRVGDDAFILRDADVADLDEAARAHGIRQAARLDRLAAAKARRAAAEQAAIERARVTLAKIAEIDAAREADEAAAAAREAAYA